MSDNHWEPGFIGPGGARCLDRAEAEIRAQRLAEDAAAINEIGDLTAWTHRMVDVPEPVEPRQTLDLSIFREDA